MSLKRATITIPEDLYDEVVAIGGDRPFSQVVCELIREGIDSRSTVSTKALMEGLSAVNARIDILERSIKPVLAAWSNYQENERE